MTHSPKLFLRATTLTLAICLIGCSGFSSGVSSTQTAQIASFSIVLSSKLVLVPQGGTTSLTVDVISHAGSDAPVSLSVSTLPLGVTASLSSTTLNGGSGNSVLTVSSSSFAATGTYPVSVTGTSGTLMKRAFFTLTVSGAVSRADFSISAAPNSQSVIAGNSTTFTITIAAINGFTGTVGLVESVLPAGMLANCTPSSISASGSCTLNVTTTSSTVAGTYTIGITGTSGSLAHSTAVSVTVAAAPPNPDFTLSASPNSQTVTAGNSASFTITVGPLNGFTGTVTLGASDLPSEMTPSFVPTSINTSGSSTLTLTSSEMTEAGTYTLTLTAASGTLVHNTSVSIVINTPPPGYADYTARTDNCETGVESDCIGSEVAGESGAALAYQNRLPGDLSVLPNAGGKAGETLSQAQCTAAAWNGTSCTSAVNVCWQDPDFGTTGCRVTDANTFPGASGMTIDNGDGVKWNTNSTLLMLTISNAGNSHMFACDSYKTLSNGQPNPDYMHCYKTPIGGDLNGIGMLQGTHANFSTITPNQFFQQPNATPNIGARYYKGEVQYRVGGLLTGAICTQIADNFSTCLPAQVVSPIDHATVGEVIWVDWMNPAFVDVAGGHTSGMLDPNYLQIWASSAHVSDDETTFTLGMGGGPLWVANYAYAVQTQIIYHATTGGYYGFFAVQGGTSSATAPNFQSYIGTVGAQFCDNGVALPCPAGVVEWQTIGLGGQDEPDSIDELTWRIGYGARYLNTRLGQIVNDDWSYLGIGVHDTGPLLDGSTCLSGNGNGPDCGNPITWAPADLHEAFQFPNANFAAVGWHVCTPTPCPLPGGLNWEVATRNVRARADAQAHGALGYFYEYANHNYIRFDPYGNEGAALFGTYFDWDQHGTYLNHGLTDSNPVMVATYMTTPARGLAPFTGVWEGEFTGWPTTNTSTSNPYRFFHEFASGAAGENGVIQYSFCTVSQDGRFAACTTDWMLTLGCMTGELSSYASPCATPSKQEGMVVVYDLTSAAPKP